MSLSQCEGKIKIPKYLIKDGVEDSCHNFGTKYCADCEKYFCHNHINKVQHKCSKFMDALKELKQGTENSEYTTKAVPIANGIVNYILTGK